MTDDAPLTLLTARLPPWAQVRVTLIGPGARRKYAPTEWDGALVVVERGEVALECDSGCRLTFREGAVLCLAGLPLATLCNDRAEPAVLSALSRRPAELTHLGVR